MADLQGLKGIPTEPQLRKPLTYMEGLQGLKSKIFNDSVMEPGFIESLTAPEGSTIDYQNISSVAGGRAREMFVDPMRRFGGAIHKGMTGKPLTIGDQLNLIEGMIDTTVGGLFQHGMSKGGFDPNTLHMFVGPKAKDIVKAEKMALRGAYPEEIHSKLLMHKKPDGMWRKEIDDVKMVVDEAGLPKLAHYDGTPLPQHSQPTAPLKDVLTHESLSGVYPSLSGDVSVTRNIDPEFGGFYKDEVIGISPKIKPTETIGHELQHAVQQKEGWARGGSPEMFSSKAEDLNMLQDAKVLKQMDGNLDMFHKVMERDPTLGAESIVLGGESLSDITTRLNQLKGKATPNEQYQNLLGEREARDTASRLGLDLEERRGLLPDVGEGAQVLFR